MISVFERRACTILFNLVTSQASAGVVLLPANICPIVVATYLKAKREVEFVDICPRTLCMDETETLNRLHKAPGRYAAILFVRTYGTENSFEDFFRTIKCVTPDVMLIDDRCIARPVLKGAAPSTFADVVLFSTGYSKFVDLNGGAYAFMKDGIAYTRKLLPYDPDHLVRLNDSFRDTMRTNAKFPFQLVETNWLETDSPVQTFDQYWVEVANGLEKSSELKKLYNERFSNELPINVQLDVQFQNWRFNVLTDYKDDLLKSIFEAKLFASSHFMPSTRIFYQQSAAVSDLLYARVVNLFNDRYFPYERLGEIIELVKTHFEKRG